MHNIWLAFALTLLSGLCTGIGGFVTLFAKRENNRFLCIGMGFSAGVMIYVSMIELFKEANDLLSVSFGAKRGNLFTVIAFFAGMLIIALIDKLIPENENPHEPVSPLHPEQNGKSLHRTGLMTAVAIAVHNFPEGVATFVSATQSLKVALPIVLAIALHNIPEGIAVATPIYYASGSRKKAVRYAFLSGLSEPLGALLAYLILLPFMSDTLFGVLYAVVAGIMVFISFDELLPSAEVYGEHHLSIYGLVGGMAVMALSLWVFI